MALWTDARGGGAGWEAGKFHYGEQVRARKGVPVFASNDAPKLQTSESVHFQSFHCDYQRPKITCTNKFNGVAIEVTPEDVEWQS